MQSTTSRSIPRGEMPAASQISRVAFGARLRSWRVFLVMPYSSSRARPSRAAISIVPFLSVAIPYSFASTRSLSRIGDAVVFGLSRSNEVQCFDDVTAVVRMGCRPGRDRVKQVAGNDQVDIGPADAADAVWWDDPAWAHGAPHAGGPRFAVFAGWLLHLVPVPDRFEALLHRHFKEGLGILIDRAFLFLLLNECRVHQGHPGPVQSQTSSRSRTITGFGSSCAISHSLHRYFDNW